MTRSLKDQWTALTDAVRSRPYGARIAILLGVAWLGVTIVLLAPPEAQKESFHNFAPSAFIGIDNFGIVISNGVFLVVGLWGFWLLYARGLAKSLFAAPGEAWPIGLFFLGNVLLAFGSGYYHIEPTSATLVWDRLAMTFVFMAFFAAVITDRIDSAVGVSVLLPLLLVLGFASIGFWVATEDLRLYRIVQVLPMVLALLICLLFVGRVTRFKYIAWMMLWFGIATALEQADWEIYWGIAVSGHSLKHLAAGVATFMVVLMLTDAERRLKDRPSTGQTAD